MVITLMTFSAGMNSRATVIRSGWLPSSENSNRMLKKLP